MDCRTSNVVRVSVRCWGLLSQVVSDKEDPLLHLQTRRCCLVSTAHQRLQQYLVPRAFPVAASATRYIIASLRQAEQFA